MLEEVSATRSFGNGNEQFMCSLCPLFDGFSLPHQLVLVTGWPDDDELEDAFFPALAGFRSINSFSTLDVDVIISLSGVVLTYRCCDFSVPFFPKELGGLAS